MKRFLLLATALLGLVACEEVVENDIIWDKPYIAFDEESISIDAKGTEELIIPLTSTGVDDVMVVMDDNYDIESSSGDLIPREAWVEVVKVISEYDNPTRALPKWDSAIVVRVKSNDTGKVRKATISAVSFTLSDSIALEQLAE